MTIDQAFNQTAAHYDNWVKKALPGYNDIFASAQKLVPFPTNAPIRVLDLGAGTGLFSKIIFERYIHAHFTLIDLADRMLDVARVRFQDTPSNFTYLVQDFRELGDFKEIDLVISSLAIHHLEHDQKQQLFAQICACLKDTGVFINVDQIRAPTPALVKTYWQKWLENVRSNGATEEQIAASIKRRSTYDRDATLLDQIQWLKDAAFAGVDIIYKTHFIGVFYAAKTDDQPSMSDSAPSI